jgi:hypothetical protein
MNKDILYSPNRDRIFTQSIKKSERVCIKLQSKSKYRKPQQNQPTPNQKPSRQKEKRKRKQRKARNRAYANINTECPNTKRNKKPNGSFTSTHLPRFTRTRKKRYGDISRNIGRIGSSAVCRVRLPVNGSVGIWVLGGLKYVGAW